MSSRIDHEPLLNAHQIQLELVMNEADSIDNKALALLATIVAVLLFMAQAGLVLAEWWQWALAVAPYGLALIACGFAIWPQSYIGATADIETNPESLTMERDTLVLQLLVNTNHAIKHNNRLNGDRWRYCVLAMMLLLWGISILFAIL